MPSARLVDATRDAVVLYRAGQLDSAGGIGRELVDCAGERGSDIVEAQMAVGGGADAVARDVHVLRRGAHLAGIECERKSNVVRGRFQIVDGIDDDLIDAGLLGIDLHLMRMTFEPGAVETAAGEVDQLDFGAHRERLDEFTVVPDRWRAA